MIIGPPLFTDSPSRGTFTLPGAWQASSRLSFTRDDRYLVVHETLDGVLQVWNLATRSLVIDYPTNDSDGSVRTVIEVPHLSGLLAVVGNDLVLFNPGSPGAPPRVLVRGVPPIDRTDSITPDPRVALSASEDHLVVATARRIIRFDPASYQVLGDAVLAGHEGRAPRFLELGDGASPPRLRVVSTSPELCPPVARYSTFDIDGVEVEVLSINADHFILESTWSGLASLGLAQMTADSALVVVDGPRADRCVWAPVPYTANASFALAGDGSVIGVARPEELRVWHSRSSRNFACDGKKYRLCLSYDGSVGALMYCSGRDNGSPNLTGFLHLIRGTVLGHCTGHMGLNEPMCYSRSGRYFATVIVDWVQEHHPDALPTGTVVVTELPASDSP